MSGPEHMDEEEETTSAGTDLDLRSVRVVSGNPRVEQVEGPGAPSFFDLVDDVYVVGRSQNADIVLPSDGISREHIRITRIEGGGYGITDLESRNGLFLNSVRVHSAILRDGDTIQVGDVVLVYRIRPRVEGADGSDSSSTPE